MRRGIWRRAFGTIGIEPTTRSGRDRAVAGRDRGGSVERAAAADVTILFLYDAHLYASNRALLEALQAGARALAVVLLRDPYDAALLQPGVLGITAYGFRQLPTRRGDLSPRELLEQGMGTRAIARPCPAGITRGGYHYDRPSPAVPR